MIIRCTFWYDKHSRYEAGTEGIGWERSIEIKEFLLLPQVNLSYNPIELWQNIHRQGIQ